MRQIVLAFTATLFACGAETLGPDDTEAGSTVDDASLETLDQELHTVEGKLVLQNTNFTKFVYKTEARAWLRWALKLPYTTGPLTDTTGAACTQGQRGPVWFLAGTTGGPTRRECTVPRGKFLFFPLANFWYTPPSEEVDTPAEVQTAQEFVNEALGTHSDTCGLELKLDGQSLGTTSQLDQKLWMGDLHPFSVEINADNPYEPLLPAGRYPYAWQTGHFALLPPLSRGDHTLEFGGTLCDSEGTYFDTHAVYTLHVR